MKKYIYLTILSLGLFQNFNAKPVPFIKGAILVTAPDVVKAIDNSDIDLLKRQYASNPTIFSQAVYGDLSPLMYTLYQHPQYSNVVETLLTFQKVKNSINSFKNKAGRTAIFIAIEHSNLQTILQLILAGAKLKVVDNSNKSPLDLVS